MIEWPPNVWHGVLDPETGEPISPVKHDSSDVYGTSKVTDVHDELETLRTMREHNEKFFE